MLNWLIRSSGRAALWKSILEASSNGIRLESISLKRFQTLQIQSIGKLKKASHLASHLAVLTAVCRCILRILSINFSFQKKCVCVLSLSTYWTSWLPKNCNNIDDRFAFRLKLFANALALAMFLHISLETLSALWLHEKSPFVEGRSPTSNSCHRCLNGTSFAFHFPDWFWLQVLVLEVLAGFREPHWNSMDSFCSKSISPNSFR